MTGILLHNVMQKCIDGQKICVDDEKADVDGQTRECGEDRMTVTAVLYLFFKPDNRLKKHKNEWMNLKNGLPKLKKR